MKPLPTTCVVLKAGKEKPLLQKHHWIFSGAIATIPPCVEGQILPVYSAQHELLGQAYFNPRCSLRGRMLSFGTESVEEALQHRICSAIALRQSFFNLVETNGFRLINGEGDGLPGLIVDRYDQILVLQIGTAGMEKLKTTIVQFLLQQANWQAIYEKSKMPTRREEGLNDQEGWLWGNATDNITFREGKLTWQVHLPSAQKTGFFLDQRAMRSYVRTLAFERRVLNCFAYTGGFSLYALQGQAKSVTSIDSSAKAMASLEQHILLNGLTQLPHQSHTANVFTFLQEQPLDYDLIILDPPAFTKRKQDVTAACRGYKEINRLALQKMPRGSILITCSCSYHIDENLFQMVIFQAAHDAGRQVRIIGRHQQAVDHPINLCHREGNYLKSLVLYVD